MVEKINLSDEARAAKREYNRLRRERMTAEQRRERTEYMREYRKNNRDRIRQHQADFWERKAKEYKQG